ncbi:MAG: cytochrome bc complex cytochrome b subunit [Chloroflexi bacterium]|nr:cytochrome bc complex cytochrome b subunit [Chloroflexota bacterium]
MTSTPEKPTSPQPPSPSRPSAGSKTPTTPAKAKAKATPTAKTANHKTTAQPQPSRPWWSRWIPQGMPDDDRGRMRMVVDNIVLHIHPTKVPKRTLRFTYTWGLGGLSAFLLVLLISTGVLLEMHYTPSAPQAYLDMLQLESQVPFGSFIRAIHHWAANLLIVTVTLHMLRVFLTGAYKPPRGTNWVVGILLFLLVVGANFTGYLLPWDQLAYWAITVGTGIISYVPFIGDTLSRLLLGGSEVSGRTLLNFYTLHISVIPISIVLLASYHFWRIRKDGGLTIPKAPGEVLGRGLERVTTIPNLVRCEVVYALIWSALLVGWAMWVPAPLEGIANPNVSPNPAKAPWYFAGLQELLLHFHPVIAAIFIPTVALIALAALPWLDPFPENVGTYFRTRRGRYLSLMAVGLALLLTPAWVAADAFLLDWVGWLPDWPTWISNGILPLAFLVAGAVLLHSFLRLTLKTTHEERVLFWFIFFFTAFVVLTIIGIFFRGPNMDLYWPWAMPTGTHG